jgi:G:T-mismatch repair DNA endonuclease (very short patch repair protein)
MSKEHKGKTYFATLNKEFSTQYKNKCFKYDFVNSILKKVIEYNGSVFHPQPYQKDDEIGWFAMDKNKTVKEARDYEKIKYEALEKRGYKILTVWDTELRKDFTSLSKKCLNFLLQS